MPELHAASPPALEEFAAHDEAASHPRAERDKRARITAPERAFAEFGKRGGVRVIGQIHFIHPKSGFHSIVERRVMEPYIMGVDHDSSMRIDASGHRDTHAVKLRFARSRLF